MNRETNIKKTEFTHKNLYIIPSAGEARLAKRELMVTRIYRKICEK